MLAGQGVVDWEETIYLHDLGKPPAGIIEWEENIIYTEERSITENVDAENGSGSMDLTFLWDLWDAAQMVEIWGVDPSSQTSIIDWEEQSI